MHSKQPNKTRSVTLISAALTSDSWQQLDFPSGDVTVIQMKGNWGRLTIFNIYNDGQHNGTVNLLTDYTHRNANIIGDGTVGNAHTIWLGDFNRHHPYWDDPEDTCLFTNKAINTAEILIGAVTEAGLEMVLPGGTPTRVPHGYGFTCGFQATGPTVTGTVPDFATRRETVPITTVSRYTLSGSGSNVNDGKTGYIECEIRGTVRVWQKGW